MSGAGAAFTLEAEVSGGRCRVALRSPRGGCLWRLALVPGDPAAAERLHALLVDATPWHAEIKVIAAFPFDHWRARSRFELARALLAAAGKVAQHG